MKIGILGAGRVAITFMKAVNVLDMVSCVAVASRDKNRAQEFATLHKIPTAYGSYEEMLSNPEIDAVYVATPHSHHYEYMQLCIQHGKHILCEKAFTVNATQAKVVLELAKKKNLFVLEGMWPRFFPMVKEVQKVLASGQLGKIHSLQVSKCYNIMENNERMYLPELAGGALLDLGCYVLNFASMFLGDDVSSLQSTVTMAETGVDLEEAIVLHYHDGKIATLLCSAGSRSPEVGIIACEKGYIMFPNSARMEEVFVYNNQNIVINHLKAEPFENFQYEIEAMAKAISQGKLECEEMPHATTILMMEHMDTLRKQWGFVLPCE